MKKPFLGYNFCSAVDGQLIPQRLQNLCIRDFAQSTGRVVAFSVSEYSDASQALMLFGQFEHIDKVAGFIFFSILCLPADDVLRRKFYAQAVKAGVEVHFALENLSLVGESDVVLTERVFRVSKDTRLEDTRLELIRLRNAGSADRN